MDNMTKTWRLLVKMVVVLVGRLERKLFEEKKQLNIVYRLTAEACTNLQELICSYKIFLYEKQLSVQSFSAFKQQLQSWIWW